MERTSPALRNDREKVLSVDRRGSNITVYFVCEILKTETLVRKKAITKEDGSQKRQLLKHI